MNKLSFSALFIIFSSIGQHTFAQATATGLNQDLSEIIISDNRQSVPLSLINRQVTVLTSEDIQHIPSLSIAGILSYVSGVDVRQRGPMGVQADIGIDGGNFDQVLILINGIKMVDPQTGHHMMNIPVPLDLIERIEVIKGPAAKMFGINALSGAINIITKKVKQTNAMLHSYAGTSGKKDTSGDYYYDYGINATVQLHQENHQHILSIDHLQSNGYRYNTDYKMQRYWYQGAAQLNQKNEINWMLGTISNKFGANAFYSAPGDKEATEEVHTSLIGAGAKFQLTKNWQFKPQIAYRYNFDDYIYTRKNPSAYRNKHATHVVNAELNNSITLASGELAFGVEARNENIISSNLGDWNRVNIGIYAGYLWNILHDLNLNAGAYVNYNSIFGWNVYPSIDLGYEIQKNWRVYANFGMAQRIPTYTDWYYVGPGNVGNPDLKPEYATTYEIGTRYQTKNFNAAANYFYRQGHDFIDWVRQDTTQPWKAENFQSLMTHGITLNASYTIALPISNSGLRINSSYTYLNPSTIQSNESANFQSNYTINSLAHQWASHIHLHLFKNIHLSGGVRYQQRLGVQEATEHKRKSYVLTDISASYVRDLWQVYAQISNLGDVQFIETGAVPLPGRWMSLGFKVQFKAN